MVDSESVHSDNDLVQSTYPGPQPYLQGIPQVEDFGHDWVMWFANPLNMVQPLREKKSVGI